MEIVVTILAFIGAVAVVKVIYDVLLEARVEKLNKKEVKRISDKYFGEEEKPRK